MGMKEETVSYFGAIEHIEIHLWKCTLSIKILWSVQSNGVISQANNPKIWGNISYSVATFFENRLYDLIANDLHRKKLL